MSGRTFILILAAACGGMISARAQADDRAFFTEKIQPILETRCFECHSHKSGKMKGGLTLDSRAGWQAGGEQGVVIVPGEPEKSLLIKAIRRGDPDLKMPPKNPLAEGEVALLVEWVKRGAADPRETVATEKADVNWWSWKPLVRPKLPKETANPIDAFISESEADRRTLIRRLYFDLHGLPPAPEEVAAFVNDGDAHAYEKLVDRVLASPRYGERWARHWLDAIHFADSHGFEHDLIRTNAWRYRDYVIESFNRDTRWARFVREQLAADYFFPDEPQLTPALGFISAGPWDQSTAQTAPKTFDYLDRDDMVTQTMSTFASATVHCARCHDHKFDPITQEDYYALQAVFAGVGKGDVSYDADPKIARERKRWKDLVAAVNKQDRAVLLNPENDRLVADWEKARGPEANWNVVDAGIFSTDSGAILKRLPDGSYLAEGNGRETDVYTTLISPTPNLITAIRLEVLTDPSLPKNGPGRAENGNLHLSEFEVLLFERGAEKAEKQKIARAFADFDQDGWTIAHAIDGNEATAWGIHPHESEAHTAIFQLEKPLAIAADAHATIQLKQLHGRNHLIGKFRLATTSDDPARATILPFNVVEALKSKDRNDTQRLAIASFALRQVAEQAMAKLPPAEVTFAAAHDFKSVSEGMNYAPWIEPKVVNILKRGDINKPLEAARPGAIAAIACLPGRFETKSEAERRAALANWLVDEKNPLAWRSIVNRVWHHHFGRGLVDSLNDFGRMGSAPTSPELLDWLACEFRDSGGSLKALHRLIVTSAAYKSGQMPARRLDAESFRDAVLAACGKLDLKMGGPPVQQFKPGKPIQLTPTVDYAPYDWDSPGAGRRSIYRFVYRGLQDPFMDALDFPDAAQLAPTRPFSASPLQSLALLNNDFVLHFSEIFARRLEKVSSERDGQLTEAFHLLFQREPTKEEKSDFAEYANKHGLAAMARLLFNSNEFFFVN